MKHLILIVALSYLMLDCTGDTTNKETSDRETEIIDLGTTEQEKIYFKEAKLVGGWGRVSNLDVGIRFTADSLKESIFFKSPGINFGSGKEHFSTFKIGQDTYLEYVFENKYGQIIDTTFQRYLFKGDTLWLDETKVVNNIGLLKGVTVFDEFVKVEEINL